MKSNLWTMSIFCTFMIEIPSLHFISDFKSTFSVLQKTVLVKCCKLTISVPHVFQWWIITKIRYFQWVGMLAYIISIIAWEKDFSLLKPLFCPPFLFRFHPTWFAHLSNMHLVVAKELDHWANYPALFSRMSLTGCISTKRGVWGKSKLTVYVSVGVWKRQQESYVIIVTHSLVREESLLKVL